MNDAEKGVSGRRNFLGAMSALGAATVLGGLTPSRVSAEPRKGRLKQSVTRGVFKGLKLDLDGMCEAAAKLGVLGIDLVGPGDFPTLKKHGLIPTMASGVGDINNVNKHAELTPKMTDAIKAAAAGGAPNIIVLSGSRKEITDEQGLDACVKFLNGVKAVAEEQKITICMELLNTRVNHPGYMADHTAWGVEVCKRVNSPRVKLLYDIYHMQIMEGDVIRTIQQNIQWIGHFHTAGNPGRHEFDDTQELNYPPICKAIADLNYQGYIAHEYTPTKEPLETLEKMLKICEV